MLFKNSKYKLEWILVAIMCAIAFFTLMYEDIHTTCWNAYNLTNSLFSGKFPNGYYWESAFYIPVHIAFAIWNLPTWILSKFTAINPSSVISLLWAKALLVVCLIFAANSIKKILKEAEMGEHADFWAFFTVSSFMIFAPIFDMSQYDIIGVSIGLYALTLVVKDPSKLSVKALILLSLASSFKMFFLFASIAVVFVIERRFKHVLADMGMVLGFSVFFVVLSKVLNILRSATTIATTTSSSVVAAASNDLSIPIASRLLYATIDGGLFQISIVFLLLFGLYFLIFLTKKPDNKRDIIYEIIWAISVTYTILITFVIAHPQWAVFPGIFMILMCGASRKATANSNIILEFIFEVFLLLQQFTFFDYVYATENEFNKLILKNFSSHLFGPDLKGPADITGILEQKPMIVVSAIMTAAAFAIIIINHPWRKDIKDETAEKSYKVATIVRTVFIGLYIAFAFAVRFVL